MWGGECFLSDVFILSGAEDLMPVPEPDGNRFEDATSTPGCTILEFEDLGPADLLCDRMRWMANAKRPTTIRLDSSNKCSLTHGNRGTWFRVSTQVLRRVICCFFRVTMIKFVVPRNSTAAGPVSRRLE